MKSIFKQLHKSTIITPVLFAAAVISSTLFFYIPYITEINSIEMATKNSIISAQQIKLTRAYYVKNVVKDIKKYAPNIKFSYDHEGVNGVLPLPTTTIHNLSAIYSANSGVKYNLYSEYPFAFKKDRVLTQYQKEALKKTKEDPEGIYVKKEMINDKPYLRVATSDYMTDQACVDCHNSHPERTWEKGMWKLGDNRGVLEIMVPLEDITASNINVRDNILLFIFLIGSVLLFYLSHNLLNREKKLLNEKSELEEEVKHLYKDFDKNVIASTTDKDGIIIYASEMFCSLSGYTNQELLGKKHNIIKHPDMPRETFRNLWNTISHGNIWKGKIKNLTKDGGFYWVEAIISPVFDKENNIIEYNAIRHDITSNVEIEDININLHEKVSEAIIQKEEKEQHMLKQSKMAQMGEMLSMIAHQWRQPLAAISATASTLELKTIIDDYDKEFFLSSIKDIQAYSQHLSLTINDFRNFFMDSKLVNTTNFESIIDETLRIVKTSLTNKNITLLVVNDFKDEIHIYESEFKQVILNLLKNAEDSLLENKIVNAKIEIKTYQDKQNAVLEIIDNGGGIKEEIILKIFNPYFSTKDKQNGTGLGLYMSKTIIENHCLGTIECFNNTEGGATFKITIDPNTLSSKNHLEEE